MRRRLGTRNQELGTSGQKPRVLTYWHFFVMPDLIRSPVEKECLSQLDSGSRAGMTKCENVPAGQSLATSLNIFKTPPFSSSYFLVPGCGKAVDGLAKSCAQAARLAVLVSTQLSLTHVLATVRPCYAQVFRQAMHRLVHTFYALFISGSGQFFHHIHRLNNKHDEVYLIKLLSQKGV
jgi:hypothetical protein